MTYLITSIVDGVSSYRATDSKIRTYDYLLRILGNKGYATFNYDVSKGIAYFIHTHPKVNGFPHSGRPFASKEDLKQRTFPTAGYYIMTPENGKILNYSLTKNRDEELEELRQESVLY